MSSDWFQETLAIETRRADKGRSAFVDVSQRVEDVVARSGVRRGLVTVFIRHTSASLVIQENADPRVLDDLQAWAERLAPEAFAYSHDDEGPDDMPAHLRSVLSKTSETIPVLNGRLALGTWQALYVWEHRRRPHRRELVVTVAGAI